MGSGNSELVERLRAREPVALRDVVETHARRIYRASRGLGFWAAEADDLTQDVFVTFLETIDPFGGRSSVSTWLFGILHHKSRERRRTIVRDVESVDPIEDAFDAHFDRDGSWTRPPIPPDRLAASRETETALRECLDRLPQQQREVFHLRQVEGLSAAEVGDVVGCTANHVGVLFHRARLQLRGCLEAKGWGRRP